MPPLKAVEPPSCTNSFGSLNIPPPSPPCSEAPKPKMGILNKGAGKKKKKKKVAVVRCSLKISFGFWFFFFSGRDEGAVPVWGGQGKFVGGQEGSGEGRSGYPLEPQGGGSGGSQVSPSALLGRWIFFFGLYGIKCNLK